MINRDIYTVTYIIALYLSGVDSESVSRRLKTEMKDEWKTNVDGYYKPTGKQILAHEPLDIHAVNTIINAYEINAKNIRKG